MHMSGCASRRSGVLPARRQEIFANEPAVVLVYLATEGGDVERFHGYLSVEVAYFLIDLAD